MSSKPGSPVGKGVGAPSEATATPEPVGVRIIVGMAGETVYVHVHQGTALEEVLAAVRAASAAPSGRASARLLAAGETVESSEALLQHCAGGDEIHAIFYRSIDDMDLAEVAQELSMSDGEFRGHAFTLSKLPAGFTARNVADYLWDNQVLLTSSQAQALFDTLLPRLKGEQRSRGSLIHALHSFCLEQHHVWEPDDGYSECWWANMSWKGKCLNLSSRTLTRGKLQFWGHVDADPSASSAPWPAEDVSGLREVARARRAGDSTPLVAMNFVDVMGRNKTWRSL